MMAVRAGMVALLLPVTLLSTGAALPGAHGRQAPVRSTSGQDPILALGRFGPYTAGQVATTYDQKLVPAGAAVAVGYLPGNDGHSIVQLRVNGLLPNHSYGAHVHMKPCGAKGEDAGPHYQHQQDPKTPSTDPKYANARNEVWLDFTTDAHGDASARSALDWKFTDRHPRSVVIHAEHTHTDAGHAGTAGPRLACVNADF
ncbi:superoxide dismutase family protein [Sphaerisporangium sp. NPDC051017]|uniref:superoxide dismutase family protein n=1 Tax=Sphaerisporangium sp. NPDC051017 TaxID=3154636 RepID=UPI003417D481